MVGDITHHRYLGLFFVDFGMGRCRNDSKVGITVVSFDTVDVVDVVAGPDRPAHFVSSSSAVGEFPAGAGIVLAIAIVGAVACHGAPPESLFTANAACQYNKHAVFHFFKSSLKGL